VHIIWCLLLLSFSFSAFSQSGEWFALESKVILKDHATIYGNKKTKAQVLHKASPINPLFSNSRKETSHHCRLLSRSLKGSMKMMKKNGADYCLITPQNSVVVVKAEGKKRILHHYQFTNVTPEEMNSFLDKQGLKK